MKKLIQLLSIFIIGNANAQIGGGWDWAFNTGALAGANIKHMKYTADGSEILFGGTALAATYFGSTTLTAPSPTPGGAGTIHFFGKINSETGVPTIIRSFNNLPISFDCITTDNDGNFYIGGGISTTTLIDLGNGVSVTGFNLGIIAKFSPSGLALWAKTYTFGAMGSATNQISLLAVAPSGNVFFWGYNANTDANMKRNAPLYKLDSNGNTLWYKDALNASSAITSVNSPMHKDKFIDDTENVHLFVLTNGPFVFDGITYPAIGSTSSTLVSLTSNGILFNGISYNGGVSNFQVDRASGNLTFKWGQNTLNAAPFSSLPTLWAFISPFYANYFAGVVSCDKNRNVIRSKDFSTVVDNPFRLSANNDQFLALPNGKLLFQTEFYKTSTYLAGTEYGNVGDGSKNATALVETDANWNIAKFIAGGKAFSRYNQNIAAYNDTYCMSAGFSNYDPTSFTNVPTLPTTTYGTVNLTGFNASTDMTTAYGAYSTTASLRNDIAIVQTKSPNWPLIDTTNWLGNTTNWNTASNWSNGVPTNAMRAMFNANTSNLPTVSTTPVAATLQVNAGINVSLPSSIVLLGTLRNEGNITISNAGYFAGLGATEWKGNGSVAFSGTNVNFGYDKIFTNSLVLNTDVKTFQNLNIPNITLNYAKLDLNNKKLSVLNSNATAISGANATSYIFGGTLERAINATGSYEFPLGTSTSAQSAVVDANNLAGVNKLSTTFTNGAITGTTPSTNYNSVSITSALNGGWFSINPNQQPTSGSYDVTLKIQNSTNTLLSVGSYTIIKRDNSTSPWITAGTYNLGSVASGIVSVKNSNLTSFSDFAIGRGVSDISLNTTNFNKGKVAIYPNPTTSKINLSFESNLENASIKIISLLGQTVIEKQNLSGNNLSVEVSNLAAGMYVVEVNDGISKFNSKFIKQ